MLEINCVIGSAGFIPVSSEGQQIINSERKIRYTNKEMRIIKKKNIQKYKISICDQINLIFFATTSQFFCFTL